MIGFCAFILNLPILLIAIYSGIYLIAILSITITLSVIAPFFDTPSLSKSGQLIYYAPLLLAEKEKNNLIIIHGGTLFDYYFVINKDLNGRQRTNFIIKNYLEGILKLIEAYEGKANDSIKIKGTSYILNERTAKKIGFRTVRTDPIQKVILIYNYVNLTISYSIAKAKLSFPNLKEIKTFEADLNDLIEHKEFLIDFHNRITPDNT
ncbi:hypothetical protein JKA74_14160 [Marivirga sp. S37H4]|uniref:Uncharacterized protein n=1 Tax=Marivirga aurantiaca TaxID=2802615 RepID=A0A935C9R3_9BACT|nr:hypothetical protein [Marivirga aurantiaca]MBK6266185.1 hypothetical protein [Marivirga aurantiaca]